METAREKRIKEKIFDIIEKKSINNRKKKFNIKDYLKDEFFPEKLGLFIRKHHPKPHIRFIKLMDKKNLVGAEIGVYKGSNAFQILKNLDMKKLYLIDPYIEYKDYNLKGQISEDISLSIIEMKSIGKVWKYHEKVKWIKKKSSKAVKSFKDESLDFVYIDGNHDSKYVKEDIELYYPKVKSGGFLCGHDIDQPNVFKEVVRFIYEKNLLNNSFISLQDWMIQKP